MLGAASLKLRGDNLLQGKKPKEFLRGVEFCSAPFSTDSDFVGHDLGYSNLDFFNARGKTL